MIYLDMQSSEERGIPTVAWATVMKALSPMGEEEGQKTPGGKKSKVKGKKGKNGASGPNAQTVRVSGCLLT